ncbi:hypothetical protein Tco_0446708 [Tanacetum coccineum]
MANNDLNFVYAEDEEDLSFLPKEPSPAFGTGSSYMSVNIEPLMTDEEPVLQPTEAMTDSGGIPKCEFKFVYSPIKCKLPIFILRPLDLPSLIVCYFVANASLTSLPYLHEPPDIRTAKLLVYHLREEDIHFVSSKSKEHKPTSIGIRMMLESSEPKVGRLPSKPSSYLMRKRQLVGLVRWNHDEGKLSLDKG